MESNKHILIVDDDAEFAGMVAQAVQDVSDTYKVQVSTDARAATIEIREAQAAARSYDLVITDIKMPGSSGLQLLETLSEIAPETKTITMTAYHSPELASRAQHLDVHAYLIKPIALSEFRQVVRAALESPEPAEQVSSSHSHLSATQETAVERQLANLRAATNAIAALFVHTTGTLLAIDSLRADLDVDALCGALIDAQRSIAQAARRALSSGTPIRQSSYSTETVGICTYRLDDSYVLVTIFGPTVREGHVSYQMRETAKEIASALASADTTTTARRPDASEDWRSKIEQYFSGTSRRRSRGRRSVPAKRKPAGRSESASAPPAVQRTATRREDVGNGLPPAKDTPHPLAPEQGVSDVVPDSNRDPLAADAGRAPQDLASEEEKDRGLTAEQTIDLPSTDDIDRPAIDEINWEAAADLDWEEIVAGADQGFAGMDFQEARRLGLIDDLEAD